MQAKLHRWAEKMAPAGSLICSKLAGRIGAFTQQLPADELDAHPATVTDFGTQQIRRKPVLNGLINEYVRAAHVSNTTAGQAASPSRQPARS